MWCIRSFACVWILIGLAGGVFAPVEVAGADSDPPNAETARREMVRLPGGTFEMGSATGHDDEKPVHEVRLDPFYMDRHEVTNRQFAAFVEDTGYVTQAEKDGYAWGFTEGDTDFRRIEGANWRHPDGPETRYKDRLDHPVVNVTWHDAQAYAKWAGKRLPTEAEWEYAARAAGGTQVTADPSNRERPIPADERTHTPDAAPDRHATHQGAHHGTGAAEAGESASDDPDDQPVLTHPSGKSHADGTDHSAHAHHQHPAQKNQRLIHANVWHGDWPQTRQRIKGTFTTTPVGTFPPNQAGLVDMIGNVWEWTGDWYAADYYHRSPKDNPTGPSDGQTRVARGGSWFCSPTYCSAYNSHYRGASPPSHAFNNVGFRCAADAPDDIESASTGRGDREQIDSVDPTSRGTAAAAGTRE